jgi:hypothetical protein
MRAYPAESLGAPVSRAASASSQDNESIKWYEHSVSSCVLLHLSRFATSCLLYGTSTRIRHQFEHHRQTPPQERIAQRSRYQDPSRHLSNGRVNGSLANEQSCIGTYDAQERPDMERVEHAAGMRMDVEASCDDGLMGDFEKVSVSVRFRTRASTTHVLD